MQKIIFSFVLFLNLNAQAQVAYVLPGSKPATATSLVNVSSGNTFRVASLPDRSVYCRPRLANNASWTLSSTIACPYLDSCVAGNLVGALDFPLDAIPSSADAISFIAEELVNEPIEDYQYDITVTNATPNPSSIGIECFDTTLFGNFNTIIAANPYNFLELSNDSIGEVSAKIVITKNDGTLLTRTTVSIPSKQQRDISIHDIAGASDTFGRITIAHTGAVHSLRAKLTKYTSSFVITASDKLESRGNEL